MFSEWSTELTPRSSSADRARGSESSLFCSTDQSDECTCAGSRVLSGYRLALLHESFTGWSMQAW